MQGGHGPVQQGGIQPLDAALECIQIEAGGGENGLVPFGSQLGKDSRLVGGQG